MDQGDGVDVLYLDFKKVFVAFPHETLLQKLYACGIREEMYASIGAFLTEREQRVIAK